MATVEIQSIEVRRMSLNEFGPPTGERVYRLRYDIPGIEDLTNHVHTIPLGAVANYQIDMGDVDPMEAVEHHVLEVVTCNHAVRVLGQRQSTEREDSPIVTMARTRAELHREVRNLVTDLTDRVAGTTVADIYHAVRDQFVPPEGSKLNPTASRTAVSGELTSSLDRAAAARQDAKTRLGDATAAHAVDKKAAGWAALTDLVQADTAELAQSRRRWFETRFGELVRHRALLRTLKEVTR